MAGPVAGAYAAPGGDATIEQTTMTTGSPSEQPGVATCPADQRVVGGGVGITPANAGGRVLVSGPLNASGGTSTTADGDIARSWYASVYGISIGPAAVTVSSLCSASSDAIVKSTTFVVPADSSNGAVATCPDGMRIVGGGVGSIGSPDHESRVQVSGPLDETGSTEGTADGDTASSWYANVYTVATPHTYKAFALCSARSDATIATKTLNTAPGSQYGEGAATCPTGRRVVGGGVGTTATTVDSEVEFSGPVDETGTFDATADGDVGRSWSARVASLGNGPRTYKVFALCATDEGGPGGAGGGGPTGGGATGGGGATASGGPAGGTPGSGGSTGGGVTAGGGTAGGGARVVDPKPPMLSALAVTPHNVRARTAGPSITPSGGATVSYTLSAPATVRFAILAARTGRRAGAGCVKTTRANRRKASCTRYVTLAGAVTHEGHAGPNSFSFSGRLAGRTLPRGNYRLTAATSTSPPALAPFRIVNTTGRS